MTEYEEISPDTWKPVEGDAIEGKLIGKRTDVGANDSNAYDLQTKEGKQVMLWGSTVLDSRMEYVEVGEQVRITFKATEQNKLGQPVKIFKVEREAKKAE